MTTRRQRRRRVPQIIGVPAPTLRRRWRRWIERLETELYPMVESKMIHEELQRIVPNNIRLPRQSTFYAWMHRNYAQSLAVSVRRLMDERRDVISLWRLVNEIANRPDALTRTSFVWHFRSAREVADQIFDGHAGVGSPHLPSAVARRDRSDIENKSVRIARFVNKNVAHANLRRGAGNAQYKDLHAAVDCLDAVFVKYRLLLTSNGGNSVVAELDPHWSDPLTVAWLKRPGP